MLVGTLLRDTNKVTLFVYLIGEINKGFIFTGERDNGRLNGIHDYEI